MAARKSEPKTYIIINGKLGTEFFDKGEAERYLGEMLDDGYSDGELVVYVGRELRWSHGKPTIGD